MKIHQIYTNNALRNFSYVIALEDQTAIAIDPWSDVLINGILNTNNLKLSTIINTHEHWDHTKGNTKLVAQHGCEVWAHQNGKGKIPELSRLLTAQEKINIQNNVVIEVLDTPGHCQAHLCFVVHFNNNPKYIFTGDILFNAGVGNCHDGNVDDMYNTIREQIETLPNSITILPGHDYLKNNLNFTLSLEPSNTVAKHWLQKYQHADIDTKPLTTTLADEKQINTFFRLNNDEIINNLTNKVISDKDVFVSLRALRDKW